MRPPKNLPIIWAEDDNYPAGGNPWNGTPTKVDPGSGKFAEGFDPGERPAAQVFNFAQNSLGQYVQYLDMIDVLNPIYFDLGTSNPRPYGAPTAPVLTWDSGQNEYILIGFNAGQNYTLRSQDAKNWASISPTIGAGTSLCTGLTANTLVGNSVVGCDSATNQTTYRKADRTWTTSSLTASIGSYQVIFVPGSSPGKFLFAGQDTLGRPGIWLATEAANQLSLGTGAALTVQNANSYAFPMVKIAMSDSGKAVAIGHPNAGNYRVWTNSDLTQPWVDQGVPFAHSVALHYNNDEGLFMSLDSNGDCWVSSDGSVWTRQSTGNGTFQANCLESNGSIWVAAELANLPATNYFLKISIDSGVTWRRIPWPSPGIPSDYPPSCILKADGRFIYASIDLSGGYAILGTSLRIR